MAWTEVLTCPRCHRAVRVTLWATTEHGFTIHGKYEPHICPSPKGSPAPAGYTIASQIAVSDHLMAA